MASFDAILLVSFGGPERHDDVLPFLENIVRGKNVPRERLLRVAEHYELFDGVSPINGECRALLTALIGELNVSGVQLPVYWANRHWHPMLPEVVEQMAEDGIRHALAMVTSAFGSYPGCRAYLDDIESARQAVGPEAPRIDKLRLFFNHPGFIEPLVQRVGDALGEIPQPQRDGAKLIFTAHSIPVAMAEKGPYEMQLREACRLVAEAVGRNDWQLAFQSRSGPPTQPWLGPDVSEYLAGQHASGMLHDVVIAPIGFLCDHMEVVYDLDIEVRELCERLGVNMVRAATVGCHPRFVRMIRELIMERLDPHAPRLALGSLGPWPDECPVDCCR